MKVFSLFFAVLQETPKPGTGPIPADNSHTAQCPLVIAPYVRDH